MLAALTFARIPKVSTHLRPITSNDNTCQDINYSQELHLQPFAGSFFTVQSKRHSDRRVGWPEVFIHLAQTAMTLFMSRKQFFVSFEHQLFKVTANSQGSGVSVKAHHKKTWFLSWSWLPQALLFMICKNVSRRHFEHSVTCCCLSMSIFTHFFLF